MGYEIRVKAGVRVINPASGLPLVKDKPLKVKDITGFWYRRQLAGEVEIYELKEAPAKKQNEPKEKGE